MSRTLSTVAPDPLGALLSNHGALGCSQLEADAGEKLNQFAEAVLTCLAQRKEQLTFPLNLVWWGEGARIAVAADENPEKACSEHIEIEALINTRGELVESFKELELLYEAIRQASPQQGGTDPFHIGITRYNAVAFFGTPKKT